MHYVNTWKSDTSTKCVWARPYQKLNTMARQTQWCTQNMRQNIPILSGTATFVYSVLCTSVCLSVILRLSVDLCTHICVILHSTTFQPTNYKHTTAAFAVFLSFGWESHNDQLLHAILKLLASFLWPKFLMHGSMQCPTYSTQRLWPHTWGQFALLTITSMVFKYIINSMYI